jgi:hypothetical protein
LNCALSNVYILVDSVVLVHCPVNILQARQHVVELVSFRGNKRKSVNVLPHEKIKELKKIMFVLNGA